MVLDAETLRLAPRAAELIAASRGSVLPGTLKPELFASALELNTEICASPAEAEEALRELRAAANRFAEERGLRLAAAGSHPTSRPEDEVIADESRYAEFVAYAGVSARRQGVSGLHVHVGMPSAEACFHALEGVLPWLPVVLALSANSPYLRGEETGMQSNRAEVLAQLPRSGAPPAFASYEEWEAFVDYFVRLGIGADYTRFWWDIRPHPNFGTLEIRMPDQPTSLAVTAVITAILQELCRRSARPPSPRARPGCARLLPAEPLGSRALRLERGALPSRGRADRAGLGARCRARRRPARHHPDRSRSPTRDRTCERRRGCLRGPRRAHARLRACQSRPRRSR